MENSGSTTTSRPKNTCGHKWCIIERRIKCHNITRMENYRANRKLGLPWWKSIGHSPDSYFRAIEQDRKRDATPERIKAHNQRAARYRQKMKDLYGGRPDSNIVARGRWILAREGGVTE